MTCRAFTLGLLLSSLALTHADLPSGDTGTTDGQNSINDTYGSTWLCPDGWVPYASKDWRSCLIQNEKATTFPTAQKNCKNLGGWLVTIPDSEKDAFVKELAKTHNSRDYWVGLSRDQGYDSHFVWHEANDKVSANYDDLPSAIREYLGYKAKCAYIASFNDELEIDDCDSEYYSICERQISCKPGYFGFSCERECHCDGESCNPNHLPAFDEVSCKWGCQRNWMGDSCDKEKQDPEVRYFCVNAPDEDSKYVNIRLYSKGVYYRAVYGLFANKTAGQWCSTTTFDFSAYPEQLGVIKISIDNTSIAEMSDGRCCGEQLKDNVFSWAIVIKEYAGILHEHDLVVNVTCDFNNAKQLVSSGNYLLDGSKPHHIHETQVSPEHVTEDVILRVINVSSGQQVKEVDIGASVALQIQFGVLKGSLLKGVVPYNCMISASDGTQVKRFLDKSGCPDKYSPIKAFTLASNHTLVTPLFSAFAFDNDWKVTFQCSLQLCFTSDCNVGCSDPLRFKRESGDQNEEDKHVTTSTIRVLPSIKSQKPSRSNHNQESASYGYEASPFVYLNPVTCTLFLVILLIFLCMYIAFLRTLRKSVYDIRKEIEVKRSRDKFLHCGCAQQKDRDYIQP